MLLLGEVLKVGIDSTKVLSVHSIRQLWNVFRSRPRVLEHSKHSRLKRDSIIAQQRQHEVTRYVVLVKLDNVCFLTSIKKNYGAIIKYMCLF